jgi:putative PIN family toxin of toxin-antitoxin system
VKRSVPIRAVLDTNIWVSAILNPAGFPAEIIASFRNGDFLAVISEPIIAEIADVLSRPRIKDKYGITEVDILELLILIEERCEHVLLTGDVRVCRDPEDNGVIETAIKGHAAYLVSRDDDIKFDKPVAEFLSQNSITSISTARFLKRIKKA